MPPASATHRNRRYFHIITMVGADILKQPLHSSLLQSFSSYSTCHESMLSNELTKKHVSMT